MATGRSFDLDDPLAPMLRGGKSERVIRLAWPL